MNSGIAHGVADGDIAPAHATDADKNAQRPLNVEPILGFAQHAGILLAGVASALFAAGTFLALALGLAVPLARLVGLPSWFIYATAAPILVLGAWIAFWMFGKTVDVERRLLSAANLDTATDD